MEGSLTPLQRSSQFILQPQPTRKNTNKANKTFFSAILIQNNINELIIMPQNDYSSLTLL